MTSQTPQGDPSNTGSTSNVGPNTTRGPLAGPFGIALSVVLLGVAVFTAYYQIYVNVKYEKPDETPVVYICSETGRNFPHVPQLNETSPVVSPYSNKKTGYRAEKCYWTKTGGISEFPTYVLLNKYIGKPEPTVCPVCGRPVIPHNPKPPRPDKNEIIIPTADTGEKTPSAVASQPVPTSQPADKE